MADNDDTAAVPLSRLFIRSDGSRRTRAEALRLYGHRSVWVAELNEALQARLAGPKPLSVPPRMFISYRWASAEDNEWVRQIVERLRARGYAVTFDRTDKTDDMPVPEFVSRIADCTLFVAILDPGYVERIGTEASSSIRDGWVFDEYNTAAHLSKRGLLKMIGLLRQDTELPRAFRLPQPGRMGNMLDVRNPDSLRAIIEQVFPPVSNLPGADIIQRMTRLIAESHHAAADGRLADAYRLADEASRTCPGIIDGHAQAARVAVRAGRSDQGLERAKRALEVDPWNPEMLVTAQGCAYDSRRHAESAMYGVRLLNFHELSGDRNYLPIAHYYLGNALDDAGHSYEGVAHLEIARRLAPEAANFHNDTGLVYRRLDNVRAALKCFDEGLKAAPADENLLVNRVAAAIESGNRRLARRALDALIQASPENPAIPGLGDIIRTRRDSSTPPILIERLPPRPALKDVVCSKCALRMPFDNPKSSLCGGCGAERAEFGGRCDMCGSDGLVMLGLAGTGIEVLCPFCSEGTLAIVESVHTT